MMIGRRVSGMDDLEQPGDYTGPHQGYTHGKPCMFFLLPVGPDHSLHDKIHHVASPPHVFRECPDGSIEIRESIGAIGVDGERYAWHGYLDEGHVWREA